MNKKELRERKTYLEVDDEKFGTAMIVFASMKIKRETKRENLEREREKEKENKGKWNEIVFRVYLQEIFCSTFLLEKATNRERDGDRKGNDRPLVN